ncbi:hypothetical protein QQ045_023486 [Rhodiola kirilowii]
MLKASILFENMRMCFMVDNMNQAELDGMVMSTLATFDNPIIDEYDRDEMEMLEEFEAVDGNNVPEPKNLWDYPCFDDVSGWMENDTSAGHRRNNYSSDNNLICEGKTFDSKEDAIYAAQRFSVLNRVEFSTYKSYKAPKKRDGPRNPRTNFKSKSSEML